jgi:L-gulonolactone oxidase
VLENGALWALSALSRLVPSFSPAACRIAAWALAATTAVDHSHRIFASPRAVKFQEMEYSIPREHFAKVMGEIEGCINHHRFRVNFPLECRFVKGDDIWLSPCYGRDSASISVHMFKGMPYEVYFRAIEALFRRYEGRPHWGKMHTLDAAALAGLYPRWEDFRRVRTALDPRGIFLNDYLRRLLETGAPLREELARPPGAQPGPRIPTPSR